MLMLEKFEQKDKDETRVRALSRAKKSFFIAKITGNAEISVGVNRYKYAWEEVELLDTTFATKSGGKTGTTSTDFALNVIESDNTSDQVGTGIDMSASSSYPATFSMKPVGTLAECVVIMYEIRDTDNTVVYVFSAVNSHDGNCV